MESFLFKGRRSVIAFLLAFTMVLSLATPVLALSDPTWYTGIETYAPSNGDDFASFDVTDSGDGVVTIVRYNGNGGAVEIPDGVTHIAANAFRYGQNISGYGTVSSNYITSIDFPNSIIDIGNAAFMNQTQLTGEITLPVGLTAINQNIFRGTDITGELKIPASITTVGNTIIENTRVTAIVFETSSELITVGGTAFSGASQLQSISGNRNISWTGVTFGTTRLMELHTIDLPNWNVGTIGSSASGFILGASPVLTEITFPEGLTSIRGLAANGPFAGTAIREVVFPNSMVISNTLTLLGGTSTTIPDSKLEYAAILNNNQAMTQNVAFFQQRSGGEQNFQAVYVYPYIGDTDGETTTATNAKLNTRLGNSAELGGSATPERVRNLTRDIQVSVQNPSSAEFSYFDTIRVHWDDWGNDSVWTGAATSGLVENITSTIDPLSDNRYYPSFEPTILDAWARVNNEDSSVLDFDAFILNGEYYTRAVAGETALPDDAVLHFIQSDMAHTTFEYNSSVVREAAIAANVDTVITLKSAGSPVANMPLFFIDMSNGTLTTTGKTTNAQGEFTLNLAKGTYVITPLDSANKVAFNYLTVKVTDDVRLGGVSLADSTPAFGSEKVLGMDFAAGTLTKAGEFDALGASDFDPFHFDYDFYVNKDTTSVEFTVIPQIAEIVDNMRLTVAEASMVDAVDSGGVWTVTIPISADITTVDFLVSDAVEGTSSIYTLNIMRAITWDGTSDINLSSALDMQILSSVVNRQKPNNVTFDGVTLNLTNDIMLPADWIPIGFNDRAPTTGGAALSFARMFSGTINGNDHTITFAYGSRPLLGYARNAAVHNLSIKGDYIDGNGLLENYFVDYGPNNSYEEWAKTDAITLEVKNFTILDGTTIRGSGITSGWASGINLINVIDSTVEPNVKIGWNADTNASDSKPEVGSFAGHFNGTITNSVSYATVYGTNYVGGLVGNKGQSMGPCEVINSAFHGTVEATGTWVGGLIGSGYRDAATAGNTPVVTIENSYVTGTVKGGNNVGGLLGGEPAAAQVWSNGIGYIRNNHFSGTIISSGENVGGIVGYMRSLNRYNIISNNYFLDGCGATKGIGTVVFIDTSHPAPQNATTFVNSSVPGHGFGKDNHNRDDDPMGDDKYSLAEPVNATYMSGVEIITVLNAGEGSWANWAQGVGLENYPVHDPSAVAVTSKLIISGDFKSIYYTGETFDTTGMTITAQKTDGTTQTLSASDVTFEGFNNTATGAQVITAKYDGVQALFTVSVIANYGTGNTGGSGGTSNTMQVTFILIGSSPSTGDIDLGSSDGYKGARYEQWIAPITYTMDEGATVLELFVRALGAKGMSYSLVGGDNYIETINGLSEFTNGPRSGWMYTVGTDMKGLDGTHPNLGLREYVLTGGEVVIWHYVNDYAHEVEDWFADAAYPALGDGTYFNKWREAIGGTSGGTSNNNITTGGNTTVVPDASEIITVPSTTTNGSATATVPTDAVKDKVDAVLAAAKNSSDLLEIVIDVNTSVNTTALNTQLEKEAIQAIADTNNIQLTITSALGDMTFDNATIKGLLSSATAANAKIVISIAQADKTGLNADTLESLSDNKAFKLTITIDGKPVENFRGTATVFLPYELGNQNAKDLTVYHVNDKGEATAMTNVWYITKDGVGGFEFTTTHFSLFMVAPIAETETNDWINPFTDVKEGDWYYEAVRYVSENSLMVGGGDGKFNPNAQLTRAMLVQVLYNNEGRPAVTAANPFTDAANGMWYTDAIIWASDSGIIAGYGSGLFGPNDNITREQVVVILNNYAKWLDLDVSATTDLARYTDSSEISSWARSAMQWANATELMLGRSATTLVPQGETTRAEIATLLMKFIENIIK